MDKLIKDLFELNRRVSQRLWDVAHEGEMPQGLSPKIIFPNRRDGSIRISEQESRVLYFSLVNDFNYFYSVETPTKEKYRQTGRGDGVSAQTDMTLYNVCENSLQRCANIEFKAHNPISKDIAKDIEKLVREQITGNWFHTLKNCNSGTFPSLFAKFRDAFTGDVEKYQLYSGIEITIVFCFCILEKRQVYVKSFSYKPSMGNLKDYVEEFFDDKPFNDSDWGLTTGQIQQHKPPVKSKPTIVFRRDATNHAAQESPLFNKCKEHWGGEPGFDIKEGSVGVSAQFRGEPRLWFYPTYLQVAPEGKGNRFHTELCRTLHSYFTNIRGMGKINFDSAEVIEQKVLAFIEETKKICVKEGI